MSDEKKLERLTNKLIKVIERLHELEKTFSRLQNETEELLRKMLIKQDGKENKK